MFGPETNRYKEFNTLPSVTFAILRYRKAIRKLRKNCISNYLSVKNLSNQYQALLRNINSLINLSYLFPAWTVPSLWQTFGTSSYVIPVKNICVCVCVSDRQDSVCVCCMWISITVKYFLIGGSSLHPMKMYHYYCWKRTPIFMQYDLDICPKTVFSVSS